MTITKVVRVVKTTRAADGTVTTETTVTVTKDGNPEVVAGTAEDAERIMREVSDELDRTFEETERLFVAPFKRIRENMSKIFRDVFR